MEKNIGRLVNQRNIGIIAHIDAGKTTTTERLLIFTGQENKLKPGEVHEGKATTDWMVQEKERGITIQSAAVQCTWEVNTNVLKHLIRLKSTKEREMFTINIIDTPGHVDFTMEVERSLRVLDGAICLLDARNGIEAQTITVWKQADRYKVPRIIFVNKMDSVGANLETVLKTFTRLNMGNSKIIVVNIPVGSEADFSGVIDLITMKYIHWSDPTGKTFEIKEIPKDMMEYANKWRDKMIEDAVLEDETIMAKYLETGEISNEELLQCIRCGTLSRRLFPVLYGSSFKNKGIQPLLDAVVYFLASPEDRSLVTATDESNQTINILPTDSRTVALVFKIANDQFAGTLSFIRVYSGTIKSGDQLYIGGTNKKIRIKRLVRMYANQKFDIDECQAGDIAALVGQSELTTGHTIASEPLLLEKMTIPQAVVSMSVTPVTKKDLEKLSDAVRKLAAEDPSFRYSIDERTKGMILHGMGELHLDIIGDRLKREFDVQIEFGKPQVNYRETITKQAEITHLHKKQTGGAGQYAGLTMAIRPLPVPETGDKNDTNIKFNNLIVSGVIPKEFIPSVFVGVERAAKSGVIYNSPVINFEVDLTDGRTHPVDSSTLAFEIAAYDAFRDVVKQADPQLLEPIMTFDVEIPTEYLRNVTGEINKRRGMILETTMDPLFAHLNCEAPLAEMFGFIKDFRSITQGKGNCSPLTFSRYNPVPTQVFQNLLKNSDNKI